MTAQICEQLSYAGITLALAGEPLESWIQSSRHWKIYRFRRRTSANWRGYHADWELRDGSLYLVKIWGRLRLFVNHEWVENTHDPLDVLFLDHDGPVLASWFSGVLRCPYGKLLRYVHLGYSSIHEFDLFFQIIQGRLSRMWMKRNEPPKEIDDLDIMTASDAMMDGTRESQFQYDHLPLAWNSTFKKPD